MTERDFELLEILNETKNITKAAEKLYITQSALSKRIAALEESLGTVLMIRSRQGIRFTPDGEEVLEASRKASAIFGELREQISLNKEYLCGTLNAGISINYAQYRLPGLLSQYRSLYPHVKTHIISGHSRNLYLQALDGSVDAAILRGDFSWNEQKILLEQENVCAILNPEFESIPLNQIPYIGRSTDTAFERKLTQWLHENNIRSSSDGIFVDNISTCVEMVRKGIGWSVVPDICLADFHGIIRPLHFADGEAFVRSTYLVYSDNVIQLPQVKAFIELVRKYHGCS